MKEKLKIFENPKNNTEEKPKYIPKKKNINAFLEQMEKDRLEKDKKRLSLRGEAMFGQNIKAKLLQFNSTIPTIKEEKEEKKIPKKIDMKRHSEIMRESIKGLNVTKESKEIKKFNIEEHMNKMKEEEEKELKKNQDEIPKNPPKKISEDFFKNLMNSNKKYKFISKKVPKKLDTDKILDDMRQNQNNIKDKNSQNEDNFENLNIRNRSFTVAGALSNIKSAEQEKKKKEEEQKLLEEERKRIREERKKREEERKRREEEERKKREEEERIKKEKEEEERKKREEEERIQLEKDLKKYEEERKKREEERKIKEEERKKREEEERKKREEEERKRREEEERKIKEENEKLKMEGLKKYNKKEEDLTENEIYNLIERIRFEKSVEAYNNNTFRNYYNNYKGGYDWEGKDIKFTFEEINQISTESLNNIEVTKTGKVIALSHKDVSKITIYTAKTYQEEDCIVFESTVNSIKINDNYLYCALNEANDNILIMSLNNYYDKTYLNGHYYSVTDLTINNYGGFISVDIKGNINVWKDNKVHKRGYELYDINTITVINKNMIAILSFKKEVLKFYDYLNYTYLECMETITDIKGSGLKNNMLQLNRNILAVAGTYIYIIDLQSLILTNKIGCFYANVSISSFHFNEKGYFFVSQALTNRWDNEIEKGILGYYQYNFIDEHIPDKNTLIKLASKTKCHEHFISAIKQIDSKTIVTGSYDGKIKFWVLKEVK